MDENAENGTYRNETIVVRALRPEEWDDMTALVWKTFLRYEACDYPEEGIHNFLSFLSDERLKKMFCLGEYPVYAAFLGEKMVGVISLRTGSHISLLFVLGEYHRRGIGTLLMKCAKEHVRRQGCKNFLTVNAAPYAVDFYHKNGFSDTDVQQKKDGIIFTPMKCEFDRNVH